MSNLKAMISSTALDLPEHRTQAIEACLSSGFHPIGMEHFPARDASGVAVSLEMVDKADICLGIYAWRYAWLVVGSGIQGMGRVSKTTLATMLAHRLKPQYPDAQICLNLRGFDQWAAIPCRRLKPCKASSTSSNQKPNCPKRREI